MPISEFEAVNGPLGDIPVSDEQIERLSNAIEGECDGLAIDREQAISILRYVFVSQSNPTPPDDQRHERGIEAARISGDDAYRKWTGGRSSLDGMTQIVREAIRAYLSAMGTAGTVAREPVRWEWKHPRWTGGEWSISDNPERNSHGAEYRPLYASPQPAAQEPVAVKGELPENIADAIIRQVRRCIVEEFKHRADFDKGSTRDAVDFAFSELVEFTTDQCDQALAIVQRRSALSPPREPEPQVVEEPKPCGLTNPSSRDCQFMKEVGGGMDGERYRCAVCGKGYFLDYEEMK